MEILTRLGVKRSASPTPDGDTWAADGANTGNIDHSAASNITSRPMDWICAIDTPLRGIVPSPTFLLSPVTDVLQEGTTGREAHFRLQQSDPSFSIGSGNRAARPFVRLKCVARLPLVGVPRCGSCGMLVLRFEGASDDMAWDVPGRW